MDQIDWLIQNEYPWPSRKRMPQGWLAFTPMVRNDQTLAGTVTCTHEFTTASTVSQALLCTHAFLNMSMGTTIELLVTVRHEFVLVNGDLASGRYRR